MPRLEPIWQHLPLHFKQNVVSNLDFKSRCRLRICSKEEKTVVDSRPGRIDYFGLELTEPIFNSPYKDTPAQIVTRDKDISTSKHFSEDDTIEHILNIFSDDQKWKVSTLRIHIYNYNRGSRLFKFFKKLLAEMNSRNIKLNVRHFELPTTFMDKKQYINFVKTVNADQLETMSLDRSTACQLTALSETDQWKKVKELKFTTIYEIEANWVLNVEKLDIHAKDLNGDTAGALIQNFLTKNFPRGSFMSIATNYPLHLQNLLQKFTVSPRNESIDFQSLTDSPIKTLMHTPLHTQKIRMGDRNNLLLIIICDGCFAGIVCSVENFEDDLINFIKQ